MVHDRIMDGLVEFHENVYPSFSYAYARNYQAQDGSAGSAASSTNATAGSSVAPALDRKAPI